MELLKWFIGIMILLWFAWFFTGGPARYEREHSGPYIKPPSYSGDNPSYKDPVKGETYGDPDRGYKDYFK